MNGFGLLGHHVNKGLRAMDIKKTDFAGSWYPGTSSGCEGEILEFLSDKTIRTVPKKAFRAGIVPHAGWYFSGALACHVVKHLKGKDKTDAIILFGRHMRPKDKPVIMMEGGLETPFGIITLHEELSSALSKTMGLHEEPVRQASPENTIELQLPFIRYFFPDTPIAVLGVPPNSSAADIGMETANIAVNMGLSIKVIGSTDLTHYGPNYGFTSHGEGRQGLRWVKEENDPRMISLMLSVDAGHIVDESLAYGNACCGGAAAAAVAAAKALGAERGELLAYTTSYDKSPGHSLVGYAGVVY